MPPQKRTHGDPHVTHKAKPPKLAVSSDPPEDAEVPPPELAPADLSPLEECRQERDELRRRMELIPRVKQDGASQMAELEKALISIRQARDSLLAQVHALSQTQERGNARIDELTEQVETIREAADAAKSELEASRGDCENLRTQLRALEQSRAEILPLEVAAVNKSAPAATPAAENRDASLPALLAAAQSRIAGLEAQLARSTEQQKESNARLIQKLISADRERATLAKHADSSREQLAAVTAQRDALQRELGDVQSRVSLLQVEVGRLSHGQTPDEQIGEQQRQIAELSAQLDTARHELRLAWEVRRPADAAESTAPSPKSLAAGKAQAPPLNGVEAEAEVATLLAILSGAAGAPEPEAHLNNLEDHLHHFAQRALCAGWLSTRRLLEVCGDIVKWLQKFHTKLALMEPTLTAALLLVGEIARCANPRVHEETEDLEVYAVDDDVDNCECIATALEKVALRTRYASKVETALQHLAINNCDLIILDVDFGGGVTGLEAHASIRLMPQHVETPILFVSGLMSARQPVENTASRNDAYLAKPYTLSELSLKALCLIIGTRLAPATVEA